jgi:hypothetical protein
MTVARFVLALAAIGGSVEWAACTSKATPRTSDSTAGSFASPDSARSSNMPGMYGMQRMMSVSTIDSMQTRVQAMGRMSPDQMGAMLPRYRADMENMLSQMTSYMRTANVPASAAWTALSDSVRQDLTRLPQLTKGQLTETMSAHQARVTRLLQMQRDMIGKR